MTKQKNISDAEYAIFLEEIKSKIKNFQALYGEECLNLEQISEKYEKLAFSNELPHIKKESDR